MRYGDKEFYEVMQSFEKDTIIYGHHLDRVTAAERVQIPNNQFYHDGYVNTIFNEFLRGYSLGRLIERQSEEGQEDGND